MRCLHEKAWRWVVLGLCILAWDGCRFPPKAHVQAGSLQGITRVACVGDSITAGAGLADAASSSYPAVLGQLTGSAYAVRNFGVSGATLLRDGDLPYNATPEYLEARQFLPDIVVIALGTNDSKPHNWRFRDAFDRDLFSMVRAFLTLPSRPMVYVCTPPPIFTDRWGITRDVVTTQIAPRIRRLGAREGWPVIDLQVALRGRADQFPDGIHPNAVGAASIAGTVESAFRGR